MKRHAVYAAAVLLGLALAIIGAIYLYSGAYGLNVLLQTGGVRWVPVSADDGRLPLPMRLALSGKPLDVTVGPFQWQKVAVGFEVSELPVLANGTEVDRILLARVDPGQFRVQVRTAPAGNLTLDDWLDTTGAHLVINGSYFTFNGTPETPIVSDGESMGPVKYSATHGALVVKKGKAWISDLRAQDWRDVFSGADQGMVSYPLLVADDPGHKAASNPRWLANRSFVATDRSGGILFGTTEQGFFSLERLGAFLKAGPLDVSVALNLDGGPLACQGIRFAGIDRSFCGTWETNTDRDTIKLLQPAFGRRWGLPIVLTVTPR